MFRRALNFALIAALVMPAGIATTWCLCDATQAASCGSHVRSCCGGGSSGPSIRETSDCGCVRFVVPTDHDARTQATPFVPAPAPALPWIFADAFDVAAFRDAAVGSRATRAVERGPPKARSLPLLL